MSDSVRQRLPPECWCDHVEQLPHMEYIAVVLNTMHMHTCMHTHTHTRTHARKHAYAHKHALGKFFLPEPGSFYYPNEANEQLVISFTFLFIFVLLEIKPRGPFPMLSKSSTAVLH